jgi:hypothetical protein
MYGHKICATLNAGRQGNEVLIDVLMYKSISRSLRM